MSAYKQSVCLILVNMQGEGSMLMVDMMMQLQNTLLPSWLSRILLHHAFAALHAFVLFSMATNIVNSLCSLV